MTRYYSSVAEDTTLNGSITSGQTTITVTATSGFPSVPYTLILDPNVAGKEEIVTVTAVDTNPNILTVTRAQDGSTAVAHDSGAVVRHGVSARDFTDVQSHLDSAATHINKGGDTFTGDLQFTSASTKNIRNAAGNSYVTVSGGTFTVATGGSTRLEISSGGVYSNGPFGAWTSITPTLGGITIGNGSAALRYVQFGKTIMGTLQISFGNTTSVTGSLYVQLPVAATAAGTFAATGEFNATDNSVPTQYSLQGKLYTASDRLYFLPADAATNTLVNATVPFTWAVNDELHGTFIYEAE